METERKLTINDKISKTIQNVKGERKTNLVKKLGILDVELFIINFAYCSE